MKGRNGRAENREREIFQEVIMNHRQPDEEVVVKWTVVRGELQEKDQ